MLNRRSKVVVSSLKELSAECFQINNFFAPVTPAVRPVNLTLTQDTKRGVLGGSIAATVGQYLLGPCDPTLAPSGLFMSDAIPDNFVNAPAVASNKVGVAKFGGEMETDIFETNTWVTPFTDSILANYTPGASLYCSPSGFLTTELPSVTIAATTLTDPAQDIVVGSVTWAPISTNLILGLDLAV